MTTVSMPSGTTYHRTAKGWRQDCGIDMPERDWRWLDRIAELEARIAEMTAPPYDPRAQASNMETHDGPGLVIW
jgi:hypothetical protein